MKRQGKRVTVHDLAAQLGVSATTVSHALNNRGRMSEATRKRIKAAARKAGYQPSLVAQTLVSGRTNTLGVIVPMLGDTVYSMVVRGVEQVAFEKDYNIVLCDTDLSLEKEQVYLDMLLRRRVEGIVLVPFAKRTAEDVEHLEQAKALGVPVVIAEQELEGVSLTHVLASTREAAATMVTHLIELGHQRIGFVRHTVEPWDTNTAKRFLGYRDALQHAGIAFDPGLVLEVGPLGSAAMDTDITTSFLASPGHPTAIFAAYDNLAARLMTVVYSLGMRVPEDIAVAGFDDTGVASILYPPLTTVHQPALEIGRRATELLFERIEKREKIKDWPRTEQIACELVIRESTRRKIEETA